MNWRELSRPGSPGVLLAQFDLDSPEQGRDAFCEAILSPDEIRRAGRLARAVDARRFLAGRERTRRALGEFLGVAPERIVFGYGPHGKPEVLPPSAPVSFSLAHAGAHLLLAIARAGRVGVDLEARDAAPDAEALAERALAPSEQDELSARPAFEKALYFLARWTAKEALLKAAGVGLSRDPARFALERDAAGALVGRGEPAIAGLRAWPVDAGPGFVAALATESEE